MITVCAGQPTRASPPRWLPQVSKQFAGLEKQLEAKVGCTAPQRKAVHTASIMAALEWKQPGGLKRHKRTASALHCPTDEGD